ncbi:MAG TPA: hypothetical protein VGD24_05625 [Gallionella sp.]
MNSQKSYNAIPALLLSIVLLTACSGKSSDSPAPTGDTLTISAPIGDLTYLNHTSSFIPNTATTFYNNWITSQSGGVASLFMQYTLASGLILSDYVSISGVSDNGTAFTAGLPTSIICNVTNVVSVWPSCATWGITVDKAAGTISFASTPVFNDLNNTETGTMTGTLTFPPF